MRKILLLIAILSIAETMYAQTYKPFKVDVGLGMSSLSSSEQGAIIFLEPSYRFAKIFSAGLRLEQSSSSMKNIGSALVTAKVYFANNKYARPYIGGGFGSFNSGEKGGCSPGPSTVNTVSSTKKIGTMIRAGVEAYHLNLSIEYNFAPATYVSALDANGESTATVAYQNSYLGLKLAISIGGGRKKK
jgi:opacity protein-like surface antigen